MNTSDVLENCIRIERILGEIYDIFREQQAACPEYVRLWEKTAQEEHNHEQQFLLAKRLACSMKTDAAESDQPSNELVGKLTALKARVAARKLSPAESLRLAIELEEKLSAFHMDQLHIFSDAATNTLFTSMMNNDNNHVEALKQAYAQLAQPPHDQE